MSTAVLEREPAVLSPAAYAPVALLPVPHRMTAAEYLAIDSTAERRSEFIEGEIVPMAGASRMHVKIAGNIVQELKNQTMERDCDVFFSDTRVRATNYYYPDAGIVCGDYLVDNRQIDTLTNPTVLIEVLSDSTQHVDRGIKLRHYLQLPSLCTYLLVSQDAPLVEQYERSETGDWRFIATEGLEAVVHLAAVDCHLSLEAIYRRVALPDPADAGDADTES